MNTIEITDAQVERGIAKLSFELAHVGCSDPDCEADMALRSSVRRALTEIAAEGVDLDAWLESA